MSTSATTTLRARPSPVVAVFLAAAAIAVLAGGFVAAAGGEAPSKHLSWASAYLVLVWGLAQGVLGGGQFLVARTAPSRALAGWQFAAFNAANAAVLAGTLGSWAPVLDAGSVVLVVSLALFAWATRRSPGRRALVLAYRVVLVVLVVSVPIGAALGH